MYLKSVDCWLTAYIVPVVFNNLFYGFENVKIDLKLKVGRKCENIWLQEDFMNPTVKVSGS